ncbi:HDOD domain-containing protein [Thalassobaculum sp. OXR-137]|uniref:HDOD domain-containing protein n=1 Tax=Thalassobaculum sp. OXR-137 TaxID=3100173 RepID=UPI002AC90FC7|nr:HDOD domain-containing protein [Thalassobaculum sp. OXR-137]WPZ35939.1 HDOD domain-containing protein [Thalassobaculum sp. OXR-137]
MDRPRIFFVDDEPHVLNGLRRMLRSRRDTWEMMFFEDPRRALLACGAEPATVVVSDMRMPGLDGGALLDILRERFPQTIRFVLSGQSQAEAGLRAAGIAHQYLSKPTDGPTLISAIEDALVLRERLGGEAVVRLVASLTAIPALPGSYRELTEQLRHDTLDTEAIAETMARDPGIATRLIQVANSSYFGAAKRIATVRGAVQFLGMETLKSLVLTYGVLSQVVHDRIDGAPVAQQIVETMLLKSALSSRIAQDLGWDRAERELVATVGLLSDVGLLVLSDNFPTSFATRIVDGVLQMEGLAEFERSTFGVDHALVGAYLLGTWGLPDSLTGGVAEQALGEFGELATAGQIVALAGRLMLGDDLSEFHGRWPIEAWAAAARESAPL